MFAVMRTVTGMLRERGLFVRSNCRRLPALVLRFHRALRFPWSLSPSPRVHELEWPCENGGSVFDAPSVFMSRIWIKGAIFYQIAMAVC